MLTATDYTTAELAEIQRAISTKPRGPHPLIDSWIAKDAAQHWRSMATRAVTPSEAESRCATAREFDQRAEDFLREWRSTTMQKINQEAITMTTTPQQQKPAIPATVPPSVSPALLEVQALRKEVQELRAEIAADEVRRQQDAAEQMQKFRVLEFEHKELRALIEGITELLQQRDAPQRPDAHGNGCVVFHVDQIVMTYDDNGKPTYKAKGGRYAKYGVRVWPEVLPALGIDAANLKPGPNAVSLDVRAELAEVVDKETGEKSMIARKVVGLA